MNNFETFDNLFQLSALTIMLLAAGGWGMKLQSRKLVVLACGYGSFILGLLFYMLHLAIIGDIPRVFYVSESSWLAGYLFFLFLMTLREDRQNLCIKAVPAVLAVLTVAAAVYNEVMGGSLLLSLTFGVIAGFIVYISAVRIHRAKSQRTVPSPFDIAMVAIVIFQNLVYFLSEYVTDYTRFNVYFAADILLTLTLCSLLPFLKKEVQQP
ncbi:MAG: hypothetical protein IKU09_03640 [Firmicutes bacterium]|nr:hypothetical protein [Bacillota bacterium]